MTYKERQKELREAARGRLLDGGPDPSTRGVVFVSAGTLIEHVERWAKTHKLMSQEEYEAATTAVMEPLITKLRFSVRPWCGR